MTPGLIKSIPAFGNKTLVFLRQAADRAEMFQFAGVGHGRRGAFAGDADGSGSSRGFDAFADVFSFCQFGGENSGKAVSGADGIDGRHFVTVDEQHVLAAGNQRAAAAERDDYGLFGVGFEFFGRVGDFFGRRVFIEVFPGKERQFGFVDDQNVRIAEYFFRDRTDRRGVENRPGAVPAGFGESGGNRGRRNFKLTDDDVARADRQFFDVFRAHVGIAAGGG